MMASEKEISDEVNSDSSQELSVQTSCTDINKKKIKLNIEIEKAENNIQTSKSPQLTIKIEPEPETDVESISAEQTRNILRSGTLNDIDLIARRRRDRQLSIRRKRIASYRSQSPPRVEITKIYPKELINEWTSCGWAEMCGRRPTMEDAHVIKMQVNTGLCHNDKKHEEIIIGIYDGHGGAKASEEVGKHLHELFLKRLNMFHSYKMAYKEIENMARNLDDPELYFQRVTEIKVESAKMISNVSSVLYANQFEYCKTEEGDDWESSSSGEDTPPSSHSEKPVIIEESTTPLELFQMHSENEQIQLLMRDSFLEMNSKLLSLNHGTTATFTYLTPDYKFYIGNVGDSRVVLCRNGLPMRLTRDHRPQDEDEKDRITRLGGQIMRDRVNGILAITRALGDALLQPFVSPDPDTHFVQLDPKVDDFIIIACDGLWDFVSDAEAVELIKDEPDPRVAAVRLRDHSFTNKGSTDNISVIVLRLSTEGLKTN
mmetsp:Transcript_9490/g.14033  ORF Transcript_9490/g.14033 Transcript_9490/m.14033 type:complete len:487 (-) Transcript_9490:31-1491(-)